MANLNPQHGATSQPQQQHGTAQPQQQQGTAIPTQQYGGTAASPGSTSALVDKLSQRADDTAHKAVERVQQTRDKALSGIEAQQAQLGERIRDVGEALRQSGSRLEDNEPVSSLFNAAGDRIERLASYVDQASPRSVASDLHDFARQRPAWFFGGAFLAGLAIGRFAKSSAESTPRYEGGAGMRNVAQRDYPQQESMRGTGRASYDRQPSSERAPIGGISGYSSGTSPAGAGASSSAFSSTGTSAGTSGTAAGTTDRNGGASGAGGGSVPGSSSGVGRS